MSIPLPAPTVLAFASVSTAATKLKAIEGSQLPSLAGGPYA